MAHKAGDDIEWDDAWARVRLGRVVAVRADGSIEIVEQMTNARGPRRTRQARHVFLSHEAHRLRKAVP